MRNTSRSIQRLTRLLPGVLMLAVCVVLLTPSPRADADNGEQPAEQTAAPVIVSVQSSGGTFEVYPAQINLNTNADHQSIIVRSRRDDGVTVDLTEAVNLALEDGNIATVQDGVVRPAADGSTHLIVTHNGETARIPVTVSQAGEERRVSFRLDVIPVFSRVGCNNGSCHGSARGQDGFNLSLFGYDPAGDYQRIMTEQPGRRVNLADPALSMLLTKSVGTVPHTGGTLFPEDHPYYDTIHRWLQDGAPDDPEDVATVTGLEIFPQDIVLEGEAATQQVTVRAHYSDGSDRDVTDLAVLMTSNDVSASISEEGLITAGARGEAFIMARFDAITVGTPVIVVPEGSAENYPDQLAAANYIDEHINDKLRSMRIVPSDLCDDNTYMRRVYLDIIGQLPTVEELDAFLADDDPNKRARLVDELLEREEFVDIWVMKWAERLQIRSSNQTISQKSAVLYHTWLYEQLAGDRPMNDVVYDLLAADGGTFENPPTNFYQVERDTLRLSENVVQVFLGARMQCAQCHNHPFDRWTMDDYYGFTAFFVQVQRKPGADPRETIIHRGGNRTMNHPVDNRVMEPRYLGGELAEIPNNTTRREVMATWLTSPENRPFNRNMANFVWDHFFGRGITHPIDDVRISNPPVNEPLLDALADRLVETDYDIKQLIRDITASHAYQRSTVANETNETDLTNFSRAHPRRIRAEVLLDCISQVTNTQDDFRGLPAGDRAVQIVDGNTSTYFLTTFGRARRDTVCSCEVVMEPNLSQALHLINGSTTNQKIRQGRLIQRMLRDEMAPRDIVAHLYRAAFSRPPTEAELNTLMPLVEGVENQEQALQDVFWALLNAKEFIFNH